MIKKLELKRFTVFSEASFSFGRKLNVIIGENGSGKTQILKFLYAASQLFQSPENNADFFARLVPDKDLELFKSVFKISQISELINLDWRNKKTVVSKKSRNTDDKNPSVEFVTVNYAGVESQNSIILTDGKHDVKYEIDLKYNNLAVNNLGLDSDFSVRYDISYPEGIFLPSRELLTIYPNYLALSKKYHLPYDRTYDDTIAALGLPPEKTVSKEYESIVKTLETAIGGKIFLQNENFYFHPDSAPDGQDFDINMTAEGWRKLGTILQLLKNGGLHRKMSLYWDEPEANLNPRLICLIAKVLIQLSNLGIQVFLTTHSLFLLKELDMLTKEKGKFKPGEIRYFNFLKPGKVEQGNTPEDLSNILLLDESLAQSDRYFQMED